MDSVCNNLLFLFLTAVTLPTALEAGKPGPVPYFRATPMGYDALYLVWKPPLETNGILTGYDIYTHEDFGDLLKTRDFLEVKNPQQTTVKLTGLKPDTTYRIVLTATTIEGEGDSSIINVKTNKKIEQIPDQPSFEWTNLGQIGDKVRLLVKWLPALHGRPGRDFYVRYRPKGECKWATTMTEKEKDFIILLELKPDAIYEVEVVSVEDQHEKSSIIQEIPTKPRVLDPVPFLRAKPMGYEALYLWWGPPEDPYGILTGFQIQYMEDLENSFGYKGTLEINDPLETRAKLTGIKPITRYRLIIRGVTSEGYGKPYFLETEIKRRGAEISVPDQPFFRWTNLEQLDGKSRIRIKWIPAFEGHLGREFYVEYKPKGECMWTKSPTEKEVDFIILSGLEQETVYYMKVVSVDNWYETPSEVKEVPVRRLKKLLYPIL